MLQRDSTAVRAQPHSVCLVESHPDCLTNTDSITEALVRRLLEQGTAVHFLYGGPEPASAVAQRCLSLGASFSTLAMRQTSKAFQVRNIIKCVNAERSEAVRLALEQLLVHHPFDLIVFPALDGVGFRTIQAKRAGLGFGDIPLAVRLDTCSAWQRDQEHRWPTRLEALEIDFAERFAFEQADVQLFSSQALLDYARRIGWVDNGEGVVKLDDTDSLAKVYDKLNRPPNKDNLPVSTFPLATVAIPHYNLGRYLPEALTSLAAQTYPHLEVLVIDDGSTDSHSLEVLDGMQTLFPRYRFLRQTNAGIGAARNRGLREASGEYFIPMDADNVARLDMVERFVAGMRRNPGLSAMSCYFLAFAEDVPLAREQYLYALRPLGGPHTLASIQNVYGDANAIFRTASLRAIGGYEIDRDTSFEDWEVFVKLVNAGQQLGVIPDHLFYYRHREAGFSRVTDNYRNHQRILRQFLRLERLPLAERAVLWQALFGFQLQAERLHGLRRYRLADYLYAVCSKLPFVTAGLKGLLRAWKTITRKET